MEDVLEVYERPYNPQEPVICVDEKPITLHADLQPVSPAIWQTTASNGDSNFWNEHGGVGRMRAGWCRARRLGWISGKSRFSIYEGKAAPPGWIPLAAWDAVVARATGRQK
jgi:hypothetical protein